MAGLYSTEGNQLRGPHFNETPQVHVSLSPLEVFDQISRHVPSVSVRVSSGFIIISQGGSNEQKDQASKGRCHFSMAVMRRGCDCHQLCAAIGRYGRRQTRCEQHSELRSDREESRNRGFGKGY